MKLALVLPLALLAFAALAQPVTAPAAPTNLTAASADGAVCLGWSTKGSVATWLFDVQRLRDNVKDRTFRLDASTLSKSVVVTTDTLTYRWRDTNIVSGADYAYRVRAYSPAGDASPWSVLVRIKP